MNRIVSFFIFISVIFGFISCKKEVIQKPDNTPNVPPTVDILPLLVNKDWHLVEAYYVSNNYQTYQKHSIISLLTPQSGAIVEIDTIIKGFTTWQFQNTMFIKDGVVILEELTSSDPKLSFNGDNVITLYFGNTTRVLTINKDRLINENVLEISGPSVGSVGGNDYNVLVFTEDGGYKDISTNKIPSYYSVDPTLISGLTSSNLNTELIGETWTIDNITSNGFTLPGSFPYTIVFNANGTYTVDGLGSSNRIFKVVQVPFQPLVDVELYDFTPFGGGNFVIQVSLTSLQNGVINGAIINDIYGYYTNTQLIWMTRQ